MTSFDYDEEFGAFRWDIPPAFNFAVDVVDAWAERDKPALLWEDATGDRRCYGFADISRLSNRLANVFAELGVGVGDRVVTVLPRVPEWQLAMVAALKVGAIAVPCPDLLRPNDLAYRLKDSGAKVAVVHPATLAALETARRDCPDLRAVICTSGGAGRAIDFDAAVAVAADHYGVARRPAETPAVMYYSSGTSGYPKGILHSQRSLCAWAMQARYWQGLRPEDIVLASTGTGWAFGGTAVLFGPWSQGACALVYDGPFDAAKRLELIKRYRVTVYAAVPTELRMVLQQDIGAHDLTSLRHVVTGSETVTKALVERWRDATGVLPYEAYGQTESLMVCANIPGLPVKVGSCGKPMPGYRVALLDEDGAEVGPNQPGIIAVDAACPALFLGYWGQEEKTRAAYRGDWYLSGDLATRDEDGYYWFLERSDDIISSAGYRIGPNDVERVLYRHPAVQECAAVGSPDALRGEVVKAFVVLGPGHQPSAALAEELQEFVRSETAPYLYPRRIEFLAALPRTDSGKVKRSELRARERAERT